MRVALVLLAWLAALPAFGQPPATEYWRPTEADIAKLEARVVLPEGAAPLSAYARFYSGVPPKGSHRITGMLLIGFDKPEGVHIVDRPGDWLTVHDGGCSVIHLTYNLATDEVIDISCNGEA